MGRPQPMIDPKTLKKAKRSQPDKQTDWRIDYFSGKRKRTRTGFIIPGFKGPKFETYVERLAPGASTSTFKHSTKSAHRVIRALNGRGIVVLRDEEGHREIPLFPGDELELKSGVEYRICTTHAQLLDLLVVQTAKYDAKLEVVREDGSEVHVPDGDLEQLDPPSAPLPGYAPHRRYASKAKEQALAQERAQFESPPPAPRESTYKGSPVSSRHDVAAAVQGVNPRPTMGNFSE